jgi:hypothetical protein
VRNRRLRLALLVAAAVIAIVGTLAVRTVWLGRDALADGDAAAQVETARGKGDVAAAIASWRAAARHYLPLAPHVDAAYDRLAATARAAEAAADPVTALAAWRAIRSASRATRSLWTPAAELAAEADRRIAALAAVDPVSSGAGDSVPARTAWHAHQLAVDPGPSVALALVAALGLVMWIGGLLWLARRGPEGADRLNRRHLVTALALVGIGAATWTIALLAG